MIKEQTVEGFWAVLDYVHDTYNHPNYLLDPLINLLQWKYIYTTSMELKDYLNVIQHPKKYA